MTKPGFRLKRKQTLASLVLAAMIMAVGTHSADGAASKAENKPLTKTLFEIPPSDAARYHMFVDRDIFSINPREAAILNPEGARAGRRLPGGAWVRKWPTEIERYTAFGKNRYCKGAIADDVRHDYPDQSRFYFFEASMAPLSTSRDTYHFFVSLDYRWAARCWSGRRTCIVMVTNRKWVGRLNILEDDLCNVGVMSDRLSAIVNRWVK
jgi:hypothetical protein